MILAIITAILAYQRARASGRNGLLWAVAGAGVFIGAQLLVSVTAGAFIGLGAAFYGWPDSIFDESIVVVPVTIVSLISSFVASWLLLRYLGRPREEERLAGAPPPPPTFGENN